MPAKAHKSKSIAQSFIGERIPYCHEVIDSLEISNVHQVPSDIFYLNQGETNYNIDEQPLYWTNERNRKSYRAPV